MNKLYNDTAVQAIANAIRAKNGSSDTYTIAEMSTALNDLSYYAKPTIENVPLATFEADGLPLNSLKVSVEPKQEGSGIPSPENVRPISGWSAVVVSDVDDVDNPTVTQTTTISLGQTVYGGEVDVVNGTSGNKNTHKCIEFTSNDNTTWYKYGNASIFYTVFSPLDGKTPTNYGVTGSISSYYVNVTKRLNALEDGEFVFNSYDITSSKNAVVVRDDRFTTPEDFKASLTTPLQVVYELATPTTFTTQPTPIKSLNGTNNLSVDCGEVIELEYFKEV